MEIENRRDVKFINDENISENAYLWRYMDIHKFLSFAIKKSLFFTRLDKFEDKREGISISHLLYRNLKVRIDNDPSFEVMKGYVTIDSMGNEMNQIDEEIDRIQKSHFANCWNISENTSESVAMWNLYSKPNSLAIKIKYSEFKKILLEKGLINFDANSEVICSPIQYIDFQSPERATFESVFTKDISFKHENEFRIIFKEKLREKPSINYKPNLHRKKIEKFHHEHWNYSGVELSFIDFESYNFEIVHHPKSQDWAKVNIEEITKLLSLNFDVIDSNLELN